MHLVYPPKFYITIVLVFSSDDYNTQEKLGTTVMKNLGGVNKVHYGLCENGEFWEILLVESGTLRKSLQFERKKLLQKAVGFEPTTQMVQYCRFSHDVTIIQNKNNSSPQTRPEKAHFIQMREKINGPPL